MLFTSDKLREDLHPLLTVAVGNMRGESEHST